MHQSLSFLLAWLLLLCACVCWQTPLVDYDCQYSYKHKLPVQSFAPYLIHKSVSRSRKLMLVVRL
jgi:hypothetical protein